MPDAGHPRAPWHAPEIPEAAQRIAELLEQLAPRLVLDGAGYLRDDVQDACCELADAGWDAHDVPFVEVARVLADHGVTDRVPQPSAEEVTDAAG